MIVATLLQTLPTGHAKQHRVRQGREHSAWFVGHSEGCTTVLARIQLLQMCAPTSKQVLRATSLARFCVWCIVVWCIVETHYQKQQEPSMLHSNTTLLEIPFCRCCCQGMLMSTRVNRPFAPGSCTKGSSSPRMLRSRLSASEDLGKAQKTVSASGASPLAAA